MANINNKRIAAMQPEFIISAIPWVTSSTASAVKRHAFANSDNVEFMTQFISITNTGTSGSLAVAFTSTGFTTNNSHTIPAGSSINLPFMLRDIYVSGAVGQPYTVMAGLTKVNATHFNQYLSSSSGYFNV